MRTALPMDFELALSLAFDKLGGHRIMSLAASKGNQPTLRSVSAIIIRHAIFFKTDKDFPKTKILLENPNVAINYWGVAIEGVAKNCGAVNSEFSDLYKTYWDKSYTAYAHEDTEIMIEIMPKHIELWDQDEADKAYFILIDCEKRLATKTLYD